MIVCTATITIVIFTLKVFGSAFVITSRNEQRTMSVSIGLAAWAAARESKTWLKALGITPGWSALPCIVQLLPAP